MPDREKVIKGLEKCLNPNLNCYHDDIDCPYAEQCWLSDSLPTRPLKEDALELLKEQEDEKKRIMKVIWDTLHEGLSIDTVADQDWVYEQIRHKIEDT